MALAQQATTLSGPPIQVQPYVSEPGVPMFQVPIGAPVPPSPGVGAGGSGIPSSPGGGSDPLNTMLSTSWGAQAAADAQALGVNASALAATCVLESGCGANVGSGSGAQGVFQMHPAAYQDGLATALAANPSLAPQVVQGPGGMNDPVTEAIAAAGYLMQASQALQNAGISNPTVLQARSYYNFGPSVGAQVAQASSGNLMSAYVSSQVLAANGISANETVGQWQANVSAQIGSAAGQTVLA